MPSIITINVFLRIALDGGLEPFNQSQFYKKQRKRLIDLVIFMHFKSDFGGLVSLNRNKIVG